MLQAAGYQAILHSHPEGYWSHILAGGRWIVWHGTARQGAFPPQPHVNWQQGPIQAYYMKADPWPLAVLLHTVSAPNKRQEPGWPPPRTGLEPCPGEASTGRIAGRCHRGQGCPGPPRGANHAHPPSGYAPVGSMGTTEPAVGSLHVQPGGRAHRRLRPPAPAGTQSRSLSGRLHSHGQQGAAGGQTPRPSAPGPPEGQRQGSKAGSVAGSGAPRRPRAPAGSPDHDVPLATSLLRPAMKGQARPPNRRHALARLAAGRRATRRHPESRTRARDTSPRCGRPGPRVSATHGSTGQPTLQPSARGHHPKVGAAHPSAGGPRANEMPPVCRQVLHKRGDAGTPGVARGARCRPAGRQGGGPATSSKGGHRVPCGMPRTPGAHRPRRPATQKARRRHPELPRGLAVQPNKDPSPRD